MRERSRPVSPRLTFDDAVDITRLHARGMAQHVIAAAFGVNQGRISEIINGKRFPHAREIARRSA